MKNTIAIASAFLAASSFSMGEIVINDFLSFEGFVDSSYSHTDVDRDNNALDTNTNSFAVDQVEISWLFDFDTVTAQIDLQYEGDSNTAGTELDGELVEQAFVTYSLGNGDTVTAGRFASMLGFEAYEPTGLYQYSTAYDGISSYAQGVKYTRESETSFYGISVLDGRNFDNLDSSEYAIEAAASFDLGNGFNVFFGGSFDAADAGDEIILNTYLTYETGAWLFAAELISADSEAANNDEDALMGLVMANYAYSDSSSVTGRVSFGEENNEAAFEQSFVKYTVAHNYALTDNLLLIAEVSYANAEEEVNDDSDTLSAAVELLFTF